MSKPINYEKTTAELEYEFIYNTLYNNWKDIAINIFEWKRLESISDMLTSEIIETELFDKGQVVFAKDTLNGYIALHGQAGANLNIYGKPTKFMVTAKNGTFINNYALDDIVLIKNNYLEKATGQTISLYCNILADIEMTKKLQRGSHKIPYVMDCSADTELTAKNIFKKIRANEPVIFRNKSRADGEVNVNVLPTNPNYIIDKLEDDYNAYVGKILSFLGLDNYIQDKAERVQSAEVEANDEFIMSSFKTMLECRKKACEQINKKFGLNLSVEYSGIKEKNIDGEEVDNEQLYSGTKNDTKQ